MELIKFVTEKINIYEARTHFSKLVERAEHGETIVIARNNVPIVELRPIKRDSKEVVAAFQTLRTRIREQNGGRGVLEPGETWKDLINEGRRD